MIFCVINRLEEAKLKDIVKDSILPRFLLLVILLRLEADDSRNEIFIIHSLLFASSIEKDKKS